MLTMYMKMARVGTWHDFPVTAYMFLPTMTIGPGGIRSENGGMKPAQRSPSAAYLRSSNDLLDDPFELRERLDAEGYLYLKHFFSAATILAARTRYLDTPEGPDTSGIDQVLRSRHVESFVERILDRTAYLESIVVECVPGAEKRELSAAPADHGAALILWIPFGDMPRSFGGPVILEAGHMLSETSAGGRVPRRRGLQSWLLKGRLLSSPRWEVGDILVLRPELVRGDAPNRADEPRLAARAVVLSAAAKRALSSREFLHSAEGLAAR